MMLYSKVMYSKVTSFTCLDIIVWRVSGFKLRYEYVLIHVSQLEAR